MPTIRLTGFFRDDDGNGWQEQHDVDGGVSVTSLVPYITNFDNLMKSARRPLLAGDGFYIGCRASYRTGNGTIAAVNKLPDTPLRGTQTVMGIEIGMDKASTAVKVRMSNAANTANSDMYLRGIWDDVVAYGQLNFGGTAGIKFKQLLDTYVAGLLQLGYGWQGLNPALTSRGEVTNYVQNADGTVTLTVFAKNGVALPAVGTKAQAEFAKINNSKSALNRTLVVNVVGVGSLKTIKRVAVSDFETEGTYIMGVKGFIPYALSTYNKLSSRKTGRPFGLTPGRRSAATLH